MPVIEDTTQCCDGLESVYWFFQLENRLFTAQLTYWKENPNASKLLQPGM
jgi:hypothetical protein